MPNYTERWQSLHLPNVLKSLPLRIAEDLKRLPSITDIEKDKSLFLYGKVGSGKTTHALQIMLANMQAMYLKAQYVRSDYEFISVPELLFKIKLTYDKASETTENSLVEFYSSVNFLILDDFGVERMTDWAFQLLYIIINRRYDNMLRTIFTSNFSLEELAVKMGDDRLTSRIAHWCKIVEFTKTYR